MNNDNLSYKNFLKVHLTNLIRVTYQYLRFYQNTVNNYLQKNSFLFYELIMDPYLSTLLLLSDNFNLLHLLYPQLNAIITTS
jgi:hypothetical protein